VLTTQPILRAIIGSLLIISLASCTALGFGPKPTRMEVSIEASPNLNPNSEGRPSPIVMRFYELSSADVFETSDFFTLYDSEMATLGKFIVYRDEMNIKPGQLKTFKREAKPETQYVGVIAAYRDLDNARWRGILEIKPHEKHKIMIHLGSLSVSVTEVGKK
jgi:type VI secretion system protein VasD